MGRTGSPGCSGAGCGRAAVVWGGQGTGENLTAVVSVDGEEVERINLESEEGIRSYSGHGYTLEVNLRPDGQPGVRVEHADCPTQDCVHTGIITRGLGRASCACRRESSSGWRAVRSPTADRILSLDRRES